METGIFQGSESVMRNTKNGMVPAYTVIIDGKKISAGFQSKAFSGIPAGSKVEFITEKNAQGYVKLKTIAQIPNDTSNTGLSTPSVSPMVDAPHITEPAKQFVVQKETIRRSALEIAERMVSQQANSLEKMRPSLVKRAQLTVAYADHFVKYIETGVVEPLNDDVVTKIKEAVEGAE